MIAVSRSLEDPNQKLTLLIKDYKGRIFSKYVHLVLFQAHFIVLDVWFQLRTLPFNHDIILELPFKDYIFQLTLQTLLLYNYPQTLDINT